MMSVMSGFSFTPIISFICSIFICCIILMMRNIGTKVVEKIKSHYSFNNFFFGKSYRFMRLCEKNMVEADRPQLTIYVIWRMLFEFWITNDTNTHSE
jgi:hypothetical protein